MLQYTFTELNRSIFEANTIPHLIYLHHLGGNGDAIIPTAVHAHHNDCVVQLVLRGSSICTVANETYTVKKGDILLVNCGVLHSISENASKDYQAILIGITGLNFKGMERNKLINDKLSPIIKSGDMFQLLKQYFTTLDYLAPTGENERSAQAGNHIMIGLLYTLHDIIENHTTLQKGQDYNLGLQIKEYIDEHYKEDLKLPDIAAALHVNIYYLSHTFKKILGYSPIQYMTHRRIGEAQNLLLSTDMTVTEIAMTCGYNNSNYFQVVFNNVVGMPPGKYRKAWRK